MLRSRAPAADLLRERSTDFFAHGNASLRIAYDGKFGDEVEVHSGAVRGRLGF